MTAGSEQSFLNTSFLAASAMACTSSTSTSGLVVEVSLSSSLTVLAKPPLASRSATCVWSCPAVSSALITASSFFR
uniref:Putative secreted protein n=1 Tax=Ixodes ricinus TaxID=34613 RepID=A0A6B0U3S1_IXORI